MAAKKKINLEELKMEQLKKVLSNIDKVSDLYQNTQLRIMLIQALGGIYVTNKEDLPVGRDALDNTSLKENVEKESTVEETIETNIEATPVQESKEEVLKAVDNIKNAIAEVMEQPEETVEDPEVAPVEVTGIEDTQETQEVEQVLEAAEETVSELPGTILEEDLFIDAGDGTQVNIKDSFNRLAALPDDESKQYIAFYLSYYDAESVAAIVNAFSSGITSDAFELLNADNYTAFLEYFNACLQG